MLAKPRPLEGGFRPLDAEEAAAAEALLLEARYGGLEPQDVITLSIGRFGYEGLAAVSSFGADSAVLLHMLARIDPALQVIFLDTGKHFEETLRYRDALAADFGLRNITVYEPLASALVRGDPSGGLHRTDTDACCNIRKVIPLDKALEGFDAWITGRKRFHGGDRLRLSVVEEAEHQLKFNPLANWGKDDLDAYIATFDLPAHPLVAQGFPSIGCWPCTKPVEEGQDVRAGRWAAARKEAGRRETAALDELGLRRTAQR